MQIYSLTTFLAEAGFSAPDLRVLNPNHENYSALLFQPQGDIEADTNGVRNTDHDLAHKQHSAFLNDAAKEHIEVAITPEYSTPWSVVEQALQSGTVPAQGVLWVIGCESIILEELNGFKDRVSDIATVLYENLAPEPGRFLDPVLYIFHARPTVSGAPPRLLIVVQFKTSPMADEDHFENNGLQKGTRIYYFGDGISQLRLATLICSDALVFMDEHARDIYDRTLVIHIQLNSKPRQAQFRQYRSRLMQFGGDQTELICLNWAKDVHMKCDNNRKCWHNISGTAWYLRPNRFDSRDHTLTANHKKGMYYTWLNDLRCHALFFNYAPSVFLVTASKVAHIAVQATLSRRSGPQLSSTRRWDGAALQWVDIGTLDDGFSSVVHESGAAKDDLVALAADNPFAAERVLALAAGKISKYKWYALNELDSCTITLSEVVNRVTACQDTDADASLFRTRRLRTAHRIVSLLRAARPPALDDLKEGFTFVWSDKSPHTNIVSAGNKRATAIYLGDDHTLDSVREIAAKAADHIGQWEKDEDAIVTGKQRLIVWYRNEQGQDIPFDPNRYVGYDQTHTDSPFDIGREE